VWIAQSLILVLLLIIFVIGPEVRYARRISPHGMLTVRDYIDRLGEPRRIHMVQREGKSYYEFTGPLASGFPLVMQSGPPAYVFDQEGRFTDWCSDPDDSPSHRRAWPLQSTNPASVEQLKQKLGL